MSSATVKTDTPKDSIEASKTASTVHSEGQNSSPPAESSKKSEDVSTGNTSTHKNSPSIKPVPVTSSSIAQPQSKLSAPLSVPATSTIPTSSEKMSANFAAATTQAAQVRSYQAPSAQGVASPAKSAALARPLPPVPTQVPSKSQVQPNPSTSTKVPQGPVHGTNTYSSQVQPSSSSSAQARPSQVPSGHIPPQPSLPPHSTGQQQPVHPGAPSAHVPASKAYAGLHQAPSTQFPTTTTQYPTYQPHPPPSSTPYQPLPSSSASTQPPPPPPQYASSIVPYHVPPPTSSGGLPMRHPGQYMPSITGQVAPTTSTKKKKRSSRKSKSQTPSYTLPPTNVPPHGLPPSYGPVPPYHSGMPGTNALTSVPPPPPTYPYPLPGPTTSNVTGANGKNNVPPSGIPMPAPSNMNKPPTATAGAAVPPAPIPVGAPPPSPTPSRKSKSSRRKSTSSAASNASSAANVTTAPAAAPIAGATNNGATSNNSSNAQNNSNNNSNENTGRWTAEEHRLFLQGLDQHGKGWKKIASLIKSRTVVQIRTHAQKYFQKLAKARQNGEVPVDGEHHLSVDGQGGMVLSAHHASVAGVSPNGLAPRPVIKRRKHLAGTKRKSISSIVNSVAKETGAAQDKKCRVEGAVLSDDQDPASRNEEDATAASNPTVKINTTISPALVPFIVPKTHIVSCSDISQTGSDQSDSVQLVDYTKEQMEDSLFRFLTPSVIENVPPTISTMTVHNNVKGTTGEIVGALDPIKIPDNNSSCTTEGARAQSVAGFGGEMSPTGVDGLSLIPDWFAKGDDIELLLEEADNLDWLEDPGTMDESVRQAFSAAVVENPHNATAGTVVTSGNVTSDARAAETGVANGHHVDHASVSHPNVTGQLLTQKYSSATEAANAAAAGLPPMATSVEGTGHGEFAVFESSMEEQEFVSALLDS